MKLTHHLEAFGRHLTAANHNLDDPIDGDREDALVHATLAVASILAAIREDLGSIDAGIDALVGK